MSSVLDLRLYRGTLADFSPAGHSAAVNNAPEWARTREGECINLDGVNQFLSAANHADFNFGDASDDIAFSVAAWVRMVDATSFCVLSKGVYNTDAEWRFLVHSDDKIYLQTFDESVPDCYIGRAYNTVLTSFESQWLFLAGTYDGSEASTGFELYVNGAQVVSVAAELNPGSYVAMEALTQQVRIGRDDTDYARGMVREAMVYRDQVLSPQEILDLYSEGLRRRFTVGSTKHFLLPSPITGRETGVVSAWEMKNVGDNIIDKAGKYDGIIYGPTEARGFGGLSAMCFESTQSQFINCGNISELQNIPGCTVIGWFRKAALGTSLTIDHSLNANNRVALSYHSDCNIYALVGKTGAVGYGLIGYETTSWVFLAQVFDGTGVGDADKLKLYVDAIPQTLAFAGTLPTTTSATLGNLNMGRRPYAPFNYNDGMIIDPRVYDRALSEKEIRTEYLKYAKFPIFVEDLGNYVVSLANETTGQINGSEWEIYSGTWRLTSMVGGLPEDKEIECVVAGLIYQEMDQAYGTWEWECYKADASAYLAQFMASLAGPYTTLGQNGYMLGSSANEAVMLNRITNGGSTVLGASANGYITHSTWYKMRIVRTLEDEFSFYLKGGVFSNWTLVDTTLGSGSNPVVNGDHKASSYICIDLDAGDKIRGFRFTHGVVNP